MSLVKYNEQFAGLQIHRVGGRGSPHKVAMLLSVIKLISEGNISDNRIYLNPYLITTYKECFARYSGAGDAENPNYPFFFLRTSPFWHHRIREGREEEYEGFYTPSTSRLNQVVEYAYLDDELFRLLRDSRGVVSAILEAALLKNLDINPDRNKMMEIIEQQKILTFAHDSDILIPYFQMLSDNEISRYMCEPPVVNKSHIAVGEPIVTYTKDWMESEKKNQKIGLLGEAFVLELERRRLQKLGETDLANNVEWTSQKKGDGMGYDIKSFNEATHQELFIEVKTTTQGKEAPFYISHHEVRFSESEKKQYSLYRVFNFLKDPKIFKLDGSVKSNFDIQPSMYKAFLMQG